MIIPFQLIYFFSIIIPLNAQYSCWEMLTVRKDVEYQNAGFAEAATVRMTMSKKLNNQQSCHNYCCNNRDGKRDI
jgi:hypothetical protein